MIDISHIFFSQARNEICVRATNGLPIAKTYYVFIASKQTMQLIDWVACMGKLEEFHE